jgi:hypothetical protein
MTDMPAPRGTTGSPTAEIEITLEMIEAGVVVLEDQWGVISEGAEELAETLFCEMLKVGGYTMVRNHGVGAEAGRDQGGA